MKNGLSRMVVTGLNHSQIPLIPILFTEEKLHDMISVRDKHKIFHLKLCVVANIVL